MERHRSGDLVVVTVGQLPSWSDSVIVPVALSSLENLGRLSLNLLWRPLDPPPLRSFDQNLR